MSVRRAPRQAAAAAAAAAAAPPLLRLLLLSAAAAPACGQFKHAGGVGPRASEPLFDAWAAAHGQLFPSREEAALRRARHAASVAWVAAHNARWQAGQEEWWAGTNQFSALSPDEFNARHTARAPLHADMDARRARAAGGGGGAQASPQPQAQAQARRAQTTLGSVNWVTAGAVTAVQNQLQCGDCYSFSALGALTGAQAIASGFTTLQDLSAQQVTDCSSAYGNDGCNGGYMDQVFDYVQAQGGVCSAVTYPYAASNSQQGAQAGTCQVPAAPAINTYCPVVAGVSPNIAYYYTNTHSNVPDFASFLAYLSQQPVAIGVWAGCTAFQYYSGGNFNTACVGSPDPGSINHAILATGFYSSGGTQYIVAKNQYGTTWGASGYITFPAAPAGFNGGWGQISYLAAPVAPVYAAVTPAATPSHTASASPVPRVLLTVNISALATTGTVGALVASSVACRDALLACVISALTGLVSSTPSFYVVPLPAALTANTTVAGFNVTVTWFVTVSAPAVTASASMAALSTMTAAQLQNFTDALAIVSAGSTGTAYVSAATTCAIVTAPATGSGGSACPGASTTTAVPLGAIIGGAVGGAVLLAIIITVAVCCARGNSCCACCCCAADEEVSTSASGKVVAYVSPSGSAVVAMPAPSVGSSPYAPTSGTPYAAYPAPAGELAWTNSYRGKVVAV